MNDTLIDSAILSDVDEAFEAIELPDCDDHEDLTNPAEALAAIEGLLDPTEDAPESDDAPDKDVTKVVDSFDSLPAPTVRVKKEKRAAKSLKSSRKRGRPPGVYTSKTGDTSYKCGQCGELGHNKRCCPLLGRARKVQVRKTDTVYRCSKCGSPHHNARRCMTSPDRVAAFAVAVHRDGLSVEDAYLLTAGLQRWARAA